MPFTCTNDGVCRYIPTQFTTAVSNLLSYKENAISFDCPCQNRLLQENKRIKNGNTEMKVTKHSSGNFTHSLRQGVGQNSLTISYVGFIFLT